MKNNVKQLFFYMYRSLIYHQHERSACYLSPDMAKKMDAKVLFSVFASANSKQTTTAPIWEKNPRSINARTALISELSDPTPMLGPMSGIAIPWKPGIRKEIAILRFSYA